MPKIDELIGHAAAQIAKGIKADGIVSIEEAPKEELEEETKIKVSIFKRVEEKKFKKIEYITKLRKKERDAVVAPIKDILMEAINKSYIEKGEKLVCVEDGSISSGYKGVLLIFDVDEIFFKIGKQKISENISSDIIEATINIALEISHEGREGRKVGTGFVIGDPSEISKYFKQLIINPFQNLQEKIKITDPTVKETIKEYAQLDGIFVIDTEGHVISSGTYIDIDTSEVDLPQGFGTRHRACLALTEETNAVSVIISESGGIIRILKNGNIVMKI